MTLQLTSSDFFGNVRNMIFNVKSRIVGDLKDAVDDAFISLEEIKKDTSRDARFVESTALDKEFPLEMAEYLKEIILPSKTKSTRHNTAFGVFIGYSMGLDGNKYSSVAFADIIEKKMRLDIYHLKGRIFSTRLQ